MKEAFALVFASAFYGTSLTVLLSEENRDVYAVRCFDKSRLLHIIRSLDGHEKRAFGCVQLNTRGPDRDIVSVEEAFAASFCGRNIIEH